MVSKKVYENVYRFYLIPRTPVIIRIDGRAFHTLTKGFKKPFDTDFSAAMWDTAEYLCHHIQNAKFAYVQSDEISILMTDYGKLTWFDNNLQKIVSVSASMATLAFSKAIKFWKGKEYDATFDSRAFNIPESEVTNYFVWRQQDATKNSILTLAQQYFSQKKMHGISHKKLQDMLFTQKDINWNDLPDWVKRGVCVVEGKLDLHIPVFTQDREYIERVFRIAESCS